MKNEKEMGEKWVYKWFIVSHDNWKKAKAFVSFVQLPFSFKNHINFGKPAN